MSKALVYKALSLLQEDIDEDKTLKKKKKGSSSERKKKVPSKGLDFSKKSGKVGFHLLPSSVDTVIYKPVDRTEENLKILKQLRSLKPKTSVALKVLELYTKPTSTVEDNSEKVEKQKSILFDDDDDEEQGAKKRKKRRRNENS